MNQALISVAFLIVAVVCGRLLPPTEAEVQANSAKPPAESSGHDDHSAGHGH